MKLVYLLSAEEDVTEGMREGQSELEQAATSETNLEREISTTEPVNVPETVEGQLLEGAQRGAQTTTAPIAQRLLTARSHLAPFSFPQVRCMICKKGKTLIHILLHLLIQEILIGNLAPLLIST